MIGEEQAPYQDNEEIVIKDENRVFTKTFLWMFAGLLVTAITAWLCYATGLFINIIFGGYYNILLISELIVVIVFSLTLRKMSPAVVTILYFVYAILNGVTMSTIFILFEMSSIVYLFAGTSALFGGLALYGYTTKKNVASWKPMLFGVLLAGLLVSLINIFMGSSSLDLALDWVILFVFFGITIYDVNRIKKLAYEDRIEENKLPIYGAMELYLDFINIFLRVLSLFGKRRN